MKRSVLVVPAALLAVPYLAGQTRAAEPGFGSSAGNGPSANRLSLSYRVGLNVDVQFRGLGGFDWLPGVDPGPNSGFQENRTYDDGFNRVDSNLNTYGGLAGLQNPGATWYWNHDSNAQVVDAGGSRYVEMHAARATATLKSEKDKDEPLHGVELSYARQIHQGERWSWGLICALNYAQLRARDSAPRSGSVEQIRDRFEVPLDVETNERFVPDAQDHMGTLNGPGPLLGSHPYRTVESLADAADITGRRSLDADLFGLRVGPYLEYPLGNKLSLSLNGGLALLYVTSDFEFAETVTFGARTRSSVNGSGTHGEWLLGGYVAGNLSYRLHEAWELFAGVQFQSAGTYTHTEKGKSAWMDLRQSLFATVGIGYSF